MGETPDRRAEDGLHWSDIEVAMRKMFDDFRIKLLEELYDRSIDPISKGLQEQQRYCAEHSQQLAVQQALTGELTEAKLVRRTQVVEAQLKILAVGLTIVGTASTASIIGLLVLILTHQVTL